MDVRDVGRALVYMASLPLDANVQFMTVMATRMPFIGPRLTPLLSALGHPRARLRPGRTLRGRRPAGAVPQRGRSPAMV